MPYTCVVIGCRSRGTRDKKSFFRVPAVIKNQGDKTMELSTRRRREWLAFIRRKDEPSHYWRVCSDHFILGKPAALYDVNNPDWVPSKCLTAEDLEKCNPSTISPKERKKLERYLRLKKRNVNKIYATLSDLTHVAHSSTIAAAKTCKERMSPVCQLILKGKLESRVSTLTNSQQRQFEVLHQEYQQLLTNSVDLGAKLLSAQLVECTFEDDDKVKYYTGLPNCKVLFALFKHVEGHIPTSISPHLTTFQKFLVTLMKLRLGTPMQDLSFRFGASLLSLSSTFTAVVDVLYIHLKSLIVWPDREELRQTMPLCFEETFGMKVTGVIDCFEVFIDGPTSLMARCKAWSQHKHHNTVKYLICIVPQGVVSFVSQGWVGRCSDQFVAEQCGFLDKLVPGDVIYAGRGFNSSGCVGEMSEKAKIPAFTKDKKRLSPLDVEATRKLVRCMDHLEGLVGLVRKNYAILKEMIPVTLLQCDDNSDYPTLDKIVTVCCALVNCCQSIAPLRC